jgi:hypothetical protein
LCGGAEERNGCGGDAAATFSHAVVNVACIAPAALRNLRETTERRKWAVSRLLLCRTR